MPTDVFGLTTEGTKSTKSHKGLEVTAVVNASYYAIVHRTLIVALFAVASFASADDAYWVTVGTVGSMGKSKDIRMVSEEVRIKLHDHSMTVRASFDFQNDAKAQTVTMAFPEAIEDLKPRKKGDALAITKFRSWVDGKEVPVTRKVLPDRPASYSAVWLKQVPLGARGKRHVVCEYEAKYGEGEGVIQAYYILRSGATWKGKIGDCKVYVDWADLHDQGPPEFALSGDTLSGYSALNSVGFARDPDKHKGWIQDKPLRARRTSETSAFFEFRNFKPKADISMRWVAGFTNYVVNGHRSLGDFVEPSGDIATKGTGADPVVELFSLPGIFGTKEDIDDMENQILENIPTDYGFRNVDVEFPDNKHVRINGKTVNLARPLEARENSKWPPGRWIHVKDLVAAMGGSYRYDASKRQAVITIKWPR